MILLFTDYGNNGPYIGQLQAKIESLAPGSSCINIHSDLPAYNIRHASCLLAAYRTQFDIGAIFLCVVDPGVGGSRLPVVINADGQYFVGPMNGLFDDVIRMAASVQINVINTENISASATFHGRDIFAPVAAAIERGSNYPILQSSSSIVPSIDKIRSQEVSRMNEVIYIDAFGNVYTSILPDHVNRNTVILVGDREISYARTFSDREPGECFWYFNSIGLVEIAANMASAAVILDMKIGSTIVYE